MKQQLQKQKKKQATNLHYSILKRRLVGLLVLYDFVVLPPLEMLSSQILQQALLSSAAFTEMCFHIPLVTCLAIVTEYRTCTCAQLDTRDRAIIGNAEFQ